MEVESGERWDPDSRTVSVSSITFLLGRSVGFLSIGAQIAALHSNMLKITFLQVYTFRVFSTGMTGPVSASSLPSAPLTVPLPDLPTSSAGLHSSTLTTTALQPFINFRILLQQRSFCEVSASELGCILAESSGSAWSTNYQALAARRIIRQSREKQRLIFDTLHFISEIV